MFERTPPYFLNSEEEALGDISIKGLRMIEQTFLTSKRQYQFASKR